MATRIWGNSRSIIDIIASNVKKFKWSKIKFYIGLFPRSDHNYVLSSFQLFDSDQIHNPKTQIMIDWNKIGLANESTTMDDFHDKLTKKKNA